METTSKITEGWSWGGSFATFYLLIASRNYSLLAGYIIGILIPFIGFLLMVAFFIIGGLKGKEWMYNCSHYETEEQKIGAIKALESIGFAMMILFIVMIILFVVFFSVIIAMLTNGQFSGIHM